MAEGVLLGKQTAEDLLQMVEEWRATRPPTGGLTRKGLKQPPPPSSKVVALLQSIESGQRGQAAVLMPHTTNERQLIDVRGYPSAGTTFTLEWGTNGEATEAIPYDATPAQLREALEGLSTINPGDVRVELGAHSRGSANDRATLSAWALRRWVVEFTGQHAGDDVPLLNPRILSGDNASFTTSQDTILADSGETIWVWAPIPVGNPTPLVAGAIGVVSRVHGFGWVLHAVEARGINGFY